MRMQEGCVVIFVLLEIHLLTFVNRAFSCHQSLLEYSSPITKVVWSLCVEVYIFPVLEILVNIQVPYNFIVNLSGFNYS